MEEVLLQAYCRDVYYNYTDAVQGVQMLCTGLQTNVLQRILGYWS
jgi:hypothetical protein